MSLGARSSKPEPSKSLSIFYDGGCRVCAWEIEKYLAADRYGKLATIDIHAADFDASKYGLEPAEVRKFFHVLTPEGKVIAGVDAFIEIWKTLGTPLSLRASWLAKRAPFHAMLRLGYRVFVEVRPYLPRRPGAPECGDGTCEIK